MALLNESWEEKNGVKRAAIIGGVLLLLIFTGIAIYWVVKTPQGVLFRDLESQNAANIVSGLDRLKIDYQLQDDGSTILVDKSIVHDTRLKLMSSGVQLGGAGFELFDETEFGMTEFVQRINFQRALQGELSRTINALDEVKHTRVHLVLPERGLFKKKNEPATASVIIFLHPGAELKPIQISGIQRLVASSVPELDPSMVTVLNDKGVTLSRVVTEDATFQVADMRLHRKKEVENYLGEKVRQVVDMSVGTGKSVVNVDAVLNFDNIKTTSEKVLPNTAGDSAIIRKHESRSEGEGKESVKSRLVNSDIEYAFGKHIEQIVKTPGSIERLSIGVLVSEEISEEKLWKIRDLVSVSIGMDASRGDAITVRAIEPAVGQDTDSRVSPLDKIASDNEIASNASGLSDSPATSAEIPSSIVAMDAKPPVQRVWSVLRNEPLLFSILVGAVFIIFILLIVVFSKSRARINERHKELSDQERERVLKLLEEWLEPEDNLLTGEVKQ